MITKLFVSHEVKRMFCIHCGEKISESANFCPVCGKQNSGNEPTPDSSSIGEKGLEIASILEMFPTGLPLSKLSFFAKSRIYINYAIRAFVLVLGLYHFLGMAFTLGSSSFMTRPEMFGLSYLDLGKYFIKEGLIIAVCWFVFFWLGKINTKLNSGAKPSR